jgi:hypothetical protein
MVEFSKWGMFYLFVATAPGSKSRRASQPSVANARQAGPTSEFHHLQDAEMAI